MSIQRELFEHQANVRRVLRQDTVEAADGSRAVRSLKIGKLYQRDLSFGGPSDRVAINWDGDWFVKQRRRLVHLALQLGAHGVYALALPQLAGGHLRQTVAAAAFRVSHTAFRNFHRAAAVATLGAEQVKQQTLLLRGKAALIYSRQIRSRLPSSGRLCEPC